MDWHKSKGKMRRASTEAMIRALMTCDDDEGVCEVCAGSWPQNELTTVWIGQGNQEEGIDLCRYCEVKGADKEKLQPCDACNGRGCHPTRRELLCQVCGGSGKLPESWLQPLDSTQGGE